MRCNRWPRFLLLFLLGGCERGPLGTGNGGRGGGPGGANGAAGSPGDGSGLPVARTGDDGVCGATLCPQGQQCCLSTGKCVAPNRVAADCPAPAPKPAICGGVTCPANQICCLLNGACIDPSTATTTCPKPTTSSRDAAATDPGMAPSCASNADCLPTQFCQTSLSRFCLGPGTCTSRSNCDASTGATFCGCDGASYPDVETACRAGVRVLAMNACGTPIDQGGPGALGPRDPAFFCATSDQCPAGLQCCPITNRCYDASIPYLCSLPPPGTSLSCLEDRQCSGFEFCLGAGCAGPGGCVSPGSCSSGELKPVCGCDGRSYTNAQCAQAAEVRTAQDGICGGADAGR